MSSSNQRQAFVRAETRQRTKARLPDSVTLPPESKQGTSRISNLGIYHLI